jgi:hypothetical protein
MLVGGAAGSVGNPGLDLITNLISFQPEMAPNNFAKCIGWILCWVKMNIFEINIHHTRICSIIAQRMQSRRICRNWCGHQNDLFLMIKL